MEIRGIRLHLLEKFFYAGAFILDDFPEYEENEYLHELFAESNFDIDNNFHELYHGGYAYLHSESSIQFYLLQLYLVYCEPTPSFPPESYLQKLRTELLKVSQRLITHFEFVLLQSPHKLDQGEVLIYWTRHFFCYLNKDEVYRPIVWTF